MAINIGDVLRIVCRLSQSLSDIQNVWHVKADSGIFPVVADVVDEIASTMEIIYGYLEYGIADNVSFDSIGVYNLTQDVNYGDVPWPTMTVGGGGSNPMLPPQCAPLMLMPTAQPKSLGKKFFPPITDNVIDDDGSLAPGYVVNMGLAGNNILIGVTDGTYAMSFGNYRPDTAEFYPYLSIVPRDFVATQRRRYTGYGS